MSSVALTGPSLVVGYPIQVNAGVLPAEGVGLIVASDTDPRLTRHPIVVPPLPAPNGRHWSKGSALPGAPRMMTLWFRSHGGTFIVSAKIGPQAPKGDIDAVSTIVRSLR